MLTGCIFLSFFPQPLRSVSARARIPNLRAEDRHLLSDQQQYLIRNKVHNKCSVPESSPHHPHSPSSVETLSSVKSVPGAKKIGDHHARGLPRGGGPGLGFSCVWDWEVRHL